MKKIIKRALICLAFLATSCANIGNGGKNTNPPTPNKRITQEQSEYISISTIEYAFAEEGYQTTEAIACLGDEEYVGIVYSDFSSFAQDSEGKYYCEAGFFQIVPSIDSTSHLLTPDKLSEENQLIATDTDGVQFIITQSIVNFESFSFIIDDWYNVVKRVGEMILEIKTLENKRENYDLDISCYSYDKNQWIYKSDKDIKEFNIEAIGLYSDYTKIYAQAVQMMNELIDIQNNSSFVCESSTYVVVSGELLRQQAFKEQKGMINGYYLSDLLAAQSQLQEHQFLYLSPNGVEVAVDTTQQAQMRVEKGIIGIIANCLLIAGEVVVIVASWGTTSIPMGFAIAATVTATCSLVYATFNLGEAISDVAYGAQGDIESKSVNYLKDGFSYVFGSEESGSIAYNVWGIANTIVSSLINPIGTVVSGAKAMGLGLGKIVLGVVRVVGVRLAEAAIAAAGSTIHGIVAGEVTKIITHNEVAAAYVKDFTTILVAIGIGIGIGCAEKAYDFAGLTKYQNALKLKSIYGDNWKKEVYDKLRSAGNEVGRNLKQQALDDILSGGDPRKYGLYRNRPDHREILDFIYENKRFPSFQQGDKIQCEFAHAVDVQQIADAVCNGKITLEQALSFVRNPLNGMLTTHSYHFYDLHGGNFKNHTDFTKIMDARPETQSTILEILNAIGIHP